MQLIAWRSTSAVPTATDCRHRMGATGRLTLGLAMLLREVSPEGPAAAPRSNREPPDDLADHRYLARGSPSRLYTGGPGSAGPSYV
jgi:hypothetical protein